ncbi:MAG: hypothetical protein H6816_05915 [Phycisphaerales bacterium]|nr:hypothetical protein [Phycisphaerales bacterium]
MMNGLAPFIIPLFFFRTCIMNGDRQDSALHLVGLDFLAAVIAHPGLSAKVVLNDRGAIFIPVTEQHRDHKVEAISYADDYAGNALAGMIAPGRIEIRNHRDFSPAEVTRIMRVLLADPRLARMRTWPILYQGRPLP